MQVVAADRGESYSAQDRTFDRFIAIRAVVGKRTADVLPLRYSTALANVEGDLSYRLADGRRRLMPNAEHPSPCS